MLYMLLSRAGVAMSVWLVVWVRFRHVSRAFLCIWVCCSGLGVAYLRILDGVVLSPSLLRLPPEFP
jgi:hypothetical protein